MIQPLHIRGAHIWNGSSLKEWTTQRDLYTTDVVTDQPANDALTVDLDGYTIFPGLINAHDHLELNHYPRSKFRDKYDNAHQWGEDMNARLDTEPYKSLRAYPLWDKLFIGGLKNLLCGATTVAHHNPLHKYLKWNDFPVNVLQKYGWAHSLHFSTDEEIQRSYKRTPKHIPWFIHLAEGTDETASEEYQRLKQLGCIGENSVLIHGVGLTPEDVYDAVQHVRGLVWCPSTNIYLLGKTSPYIQYTYADRPTWRGAAKGCNIALGSDSRLTADGDLLHEMRAANMTSQCDGGCVEEAVWERAAHILGLTNVGHLSVGANADWIANFDRERAGLALVVKGGVPQIGDPDVMAKFPHIQTVAATLDGQPKRIQLDLAHRIHQNQLKEPGLEVDELPKRKFVLW
ncbi:MAG: hypothetical protein ABI690_22680 [Chloroflexota bacterium]